MFGTIKPTASLSSGLLARKGQARPAMRPQGFHGQAGDFGKSTVGLDDLGWNDMGEDDIGEDEAPIVSIATAAPPETPPVASVPSVLVERAALLEAVTPVEDDADAAPLPPLGADAARRIARELSAKTVKAAFTLRLDPDRHLRLRLASASRNRSAQALVVQALDAFIESLPEVEGLAAQLSPKAAGGQS
ncbi:hypothetical protein [Sphingomonas sp. RS2018]